MIIGVHFLSDVVGGWLAAAALVSGLLIVRRRSALPRR
jgi:membrane-associated phospholipid phosphatase